jgi:hypothetical protein
MGSFESQFDIDYMQVTDLNLLLRKILDKCNDKDIAGFKKNNAAILPMLPAFNTVAEAREQLNKVSVSPQDPQYLFPCYHVKGMTATTMKLKAVPKSSRWH